MEYLYLICWWKVFTFDQLFTAIIGRTILSDACSLADQLIECNVYTE